jgi:hypothetical protein
VGDRIGEPSFDEIPDSLAVEVEVPQSPTEVITRVIAVDCQLSVITQRILEMRLDISHR